MNIIFRDTTWPPEDGEYFDKLILYKDDWDDFSYKTTFHFVYCDNEGEVHKIGDVKIYFYDYDEKRDSDYYKKAVYTTIPKTIKKLDENKYCSLGQRLSYYSNLKKIFPDYYKNILNSLNDIATNKILEERFIDECGVQTSLLRESSAEKALKEARMLLETDNIQENDVSFKYKLRVPYSSEPVDLYFDFKKQPELPYRVNILVGKNGTGKTQILTKLANSLSGVSDSVEDREALFIGNRPPVDKVISISYSAFDSFKRRSAGDEFSHGYLQSYVYCGIQSEEGTLSLEMLRKNFKKAYDLINTEGRFDVWKSIMSEVMEPEHQNLISNIEEGNIDNINWSSGQHILVCTITEIIANIERESIILFDEPEIHLHPNAISNTIRMFYKLLEEFDSYAIFATHSPLIVQETPASYIQILERINNTLIVKRPLVECFGENITQISNEIFDVSQTESNYKSVLKKMSERLSYDQILDLFDGNLSFNAMIYLKNSCIENGGDNND